MGGWDRAGTGSRPLGRVSLLRPNSAPDFPTEGDPARPPRTACSALQRRGAPPAFLSRSTVTLRSAARFCSGGEHCRALARCPTSAGLVCACIAWGLQLWSLLPSRTVCSRSRRRNRRRNHRPAPRILTTVGAPRHSVRRGQRRGARGGRPSARRCGDWRRSCPPSTCGAPRPAPLPLSHACPGLLPARRLVFPWATLGLFFLS